MHHAKCTISFRQATKSHWLEALAADSLLKINKLEKDLETNASYRFNKSMIYRMVGSLAEFVPEYRALKEIVLNSEAMAAYGTIDFTTVKGMDETTFHTNPAYIDAFSQLGGFVMNANENSDLENEVFVNQGWGSLQLFESLKSNKTYRAYVHMSQTEGSIWEGSLTILDDDKLVGVFENIQVSGKIPSVPYHDLKRRCSILYLVPSWIMPCVLTHSFWL